MTASLTFHWSVNSLIFSYFPILTTLSHEEGISLRHSSYNQSCHHKLMTVKCDLGIYGTQYIGQLGYLVVTMGWLLKNLCSTIFEDTNNSVWLISEDMKSYSGKNIVFVHTSLHLFIWISPFCFFIGACYIKLYDNKHPHLKYQYNNSIITMYLFFYLLIRKTPSIISGL